MIAINSMHKFMHFLTICLTAGLFQSDCFVRVRVTPDCFNNLTVLLEYIDLVSHAQGCRFFLRWRYTSYLTQETM